MNKIQKILLNQMMINLKNLHQERNKYYEEGRLDRVAYIDKQIFNKKNKIKDYKRQIGL